MASLGLENVAQEAETPFFLLHVVQVETPVLRHFAWVGEDGFEQCDIEHYGKAPEKRDINNCVGGLGHLLAVNVFCVHECDQHNRDVNVDYKQWIAELSERHNQLLIMQPNDCQLHQNDIDSFNDGCYLTAEAIYFGISLGESHQVKLLDPSFATFLLFNHDWDDLKEVDQKWSLYEHIVFIVTNATCQSINSGSHWAVLVFHPKGDCFTFLDSMGYHNKQIIENAINIAKKARAIIAINEELLNELPKVEMFKHVPLQDNNYDCGVYSIALSLTIQLQGANHPNQWNLQVITPQYVTSLRKTLHEKAKQLK